MTKEAIHIKIQAYPFVRIDSWASEQLGAMGIDLPHTDKKIC